ncbi:VOC family protein [Roseovarius nanhaiticus]|uniref:VOC family protein n=1 Tax=Roseovarius nanhaiticus TaxID=573024 RepID=UPI00248F9A27|nr:VOC family protein [Roseovarius nanhaiticus]
MNFSRVGIILNTKKYEECLNFYKFVLGLPVEGQFGDGDDQITIFSLEGCYLMVEHGGTSHPGSKPRDICPTKFRFNVPDIDVACDELRAKGVEVNVLKHEWGTTAEFADPDGNRCALRSAQDFG